MTTLIVQYDASLLSGVDGTTISSFQNTGTWGTVGNLTNAPSAGWPTLTTVNGNKALKFTQALSSFQRLVSSGLGTGSYTLSGNKTYFLVAQYDQTGSDAGRIFSSTYMATADNWLLGHHGGRSCIAYTALMTPEKFLNGVEASDKYNTGTAKAGRYVYCLTQQTAQNGNITTTMYVNNVFKGSLTATSSEAHIPLNFSIGGAGINNTNGEMSDCIFCEARVYDGVLTSSEITSITNTLSTKWAPNTLVSPTELTLDLRDIIKQYNGVATVDTSRINLSTLSLVGEIDPTKPVSVTGLAVADTSSRNAETYFSIATVTLSDPANYIVNPYNIRVSINKITITVLVTNITKEYDGAFTTTITPVNYPAFYPIDSASISSVITYTNKDVGQNIPVTIVNTETNVQNYNITYVSDSSGTITTKPLTLDIQIDSKIYDGTTDATWSGTPSLVGLISGDIVTPTGITASFNNPDVGNNKPVYVTFGITGAGSGNYTPAPTTKTANIISNTPLQPPQPLYKNSPTTDTTAGRETARVGSISMRQSKAQGTFLPASFQDWIRHLK